MSHYYLMIFQTISMQKAPNEREGYAHAKIINEIFEEFNIPIFSVPRIYSDELFQENKLFD